MHKKKMNNIHTTIQDSENYDPDLDLVLIPNTELDTSNFLTDIGFDKVVVNKDRTTETQPVLPKNINMCSSRCTAKLSCENVKSKMTRFVDGVVVESGDVQNFDSNVVIKEITVQNIQ